jgi:hypothetical protein
VFNKVFFSNLDPLAGTVASLGTFVTGSWPGRSEAWCSATSATGWAASACWC